MQPQQLRLPRCTSSSQVLELSEKVYPDTMAVLWLKVSGSRSLLSAALRDLIHNHSPEDKKTPSLNNPVKVWKYCQVSSIYGNEGVEMGTEEEGKSVTSS